MIQLPKIHESSRMVRPILWIFLILGSFPDVSCHCKSGLEFLGSFINDVEDQMNRVLHVSNDVCKNCKDYPGCFRDLISALKEDIDGLRAEESKLIDTFLAAECSYQDVTVVVGVSDGPVRVFRSSGATVLPIDKAWGVDYEAANDMLIYNTMLEVYRTDLSGNSPVMMDANVPPGFYTRPEIMEGGETFYHPTFFGDLYKYSGGTTVQILYKADTGGIFAIALDEFEGHIYWTSPIDNTDQLKRSTLEGANIETVITDPRDFLTLDIDPSTRMLYYTTKEPKVLVQYDLRTGTATDITSLAAAPTDMSVCVNRIYLAYNLHSRYEVRTRDGTVLDELSQTGLGINDFVSIATSNQQP